MIVDIRRGTIYRRTVLSINNDIKDAIRSIKVLGSHCMAITGSAHLRVLDTRHLESTRPFTIRTVNG